MKNYMKRIDIEYLKSIHNGNINTPTMYYNPIKIVREIFWNRLNILTKFIEENNNIKKNRCLDFGGGSGVFLPTLCEIFDEVILMDLDPSQAEIIKREYKLDNCKILKEDIYTYNIENIDCIIVADVIEHFQDTRQILNRLKSLMNRNTYLLSSLPTENWFYDFVRFVGKQEKPWDHYYGSNEIEIIYKELEFEQVSKKYIPTAPFNMFSMTQWRLK